MKAALQPFYSNGRREVASRPGKPGYTVHELKTHPQHYRAVDARIKTFEVRWNGDRDFKIGDRLWLREWDPADNSYTGESLVALVTHILPSHDGLTEGFVCMAIVVL
ncbi:MAG TPA: DUF3850 domain-containing protein [Verrucomicrobiae bacterium]|nr:DUF3850 domain-containing protein [Verrucomicrobiae bacterium]